MSITEVSSLACAALFTLYPGPLLAAFTDAYGGYYAIKKRLLLATYDDYGTYGVIFRAAPDRLVFNTVNAFNDIYLKHKIKKAHIYIHTQFNPQINIFGTLDPEHHRQKRKLYGRVLSDRSLRIFELDMMNEIDAFLGQLHKSTHGQEPGNMTTLCERLAVDIVGQLAFGQRLRTQTETTNRVFAQDMAAGNFVSIVKARMALPKDAKHDSYSQYADGDGAGSVDAVGLAHSSLWAEAVFLLPAGGTTMRAALSAPFFYLSRNNEAYRKLAAEIRTKFPSGGDIRGGPELSEYQYLQAVIDESMRMSPPFLGTFWREQDTSATTDPLVVDGHIVPTGTIVGVNPYGLMHNEAYFPAPFEFRPERWLAEEGDEEDRATQIAPMRKAFAPFALGESNCLGKGIAYLETSPTIAKTLWYFDFVKAPGELGKIGGGDPALKDGGRHRAGEFQLLDIATTDHDGPYLVFKYRERLWDDFQLHKGLLER